MANLVREMTLGEEIINLATKDIDIPTVERMYKKYLELNNERDSNKNDDNWWGRDNSQDNRALLDATEQNINDLFRSGTDVCLNDIYDTLGLGRPFSNDDPIYIHRPEDEKILPDTFKIGTKIDIPLRDLGTFTATCHKIENDRVLFIFDECVAIKTMEIENEMIDGGFFDTNIYNWLNDPFHSTFPKELKEKIHDIVIPSIGEVFGWDDSLENSFEFADDNERPEYLYGDQLPLMTKVLNRVSSYDGLLCSYWLRNEIRKPAIGFAAMSQTGQKIIVGGTSLYSLGVRPAFWLNK